MALPLVTEWAVMDFVSGRSMQRITPVRVTLHTAVTSSQDTYGPGLGPGRTHAHFYNPKTGKPRLHQELNKKAWADLDGNTSSISVEHWDGYPGSAPGYWKHNGDVPPFTAAQIENAALIFAYAVEYFGVPNRIATPKDTSGLAWHRLGVTGNFGKFDRNDRKTWSAAQTGERWSLARGKLCPGDRRIDQIPQIFARAQELLKTSGPTIIPAPSKPTNAVPVSTSLEETMALMQDPAGRVWVTNGLTKRHIPGPTHLADSQKMFGSIHKVSAAVADSIPIDRSKTTADLTEKTNHAAGRLDRSMPRVEAEMAALQTAVGVLANGQGLDPSLVQRTIEESVDKALAGLSVTLTAEPGLGSDKEG